MTEYMSNKLYNENCITGDSDHLYKRLRLSMKRARKIDIAVAFLMESGVRLLEEDFRDVVKRGVPVRLLCGNYLGITQPHALYLLKTIFGGRLDLQFYNVPGRSFHPKAYMFECEEGGDIYIGSSNV